MHNAENFNVLVKMLEISVLCKIGEYYTFSAFSTFSTTIGTCTACSWKY